MKVEAAHFFEVSNIERIVSRLIPEENGLQSHGWENLGFHHT
jgi:hypothetical protein